MIEATPLGDPSAPTPPGDQLEPTPEAQGEALPAAGHEAARPTTGPPRLAYRLLTGADDRAFCERVSAALADGYVLHGGPAVAVRGSTVVCAQAVVLPDVRPAVPPGRPAVPPEGPEDLPEVPPGATS